MKLFTKIIFVLKKCNKMLISIISVLQHVVSLIRSSTHFKTQSKVCNSVTTESERKEEVMITANQVAYWTLQEQIRSNQAREEETQRSNVAKEDIARAETQEKHRANVAKETETKRHNVSTEILDFSDNTPVAMGVAAGIHAGKELFEAIDDARGTASTSTTKDQNFTTNSSKGGGGHGGRAGRKEK